MHRALTVAVVLAVVAGSVPAAASLADGTPSTPEPGASFAGVVGVQEAEVDNEVANRSLDRQLRAAGTNRSKASVVASESERLEERLAELEAEKERLQEAYENGNISRGQYRARLAVVAAELRALERRANHTADTAERLPPEALREAGANASHVRSIAQQADRAGGGAVAEAAREIAGNGVGDGLGNRPAHAGPPNGSEAGPPENAGGPDDAGPPTAENGTAENASERPGNGGAGPPSNAGNETTNASDGMTNPPSQAGNGSSPGDAPNATNATNATNGTGDTGDGAGVGDNASERPGSDDGNASNATDDETDASNATENETASSGPDSGQGVGSDGDTDDGNETATDAESVGRPALAPE